MIRSDLILALALFAGGAFPVGVSAQQSEILWHVTTGKDIEANTSTLISSTEEVFSVSLSVGWDCDVRRLSETGRRVVCRKDDDETAFSVDCSGRRDEDHVQLQFRDRDTNGQDFIEVSCRRAGA